MSLCIIINFKCLSLNSSAHLVSKNRPQYRKCHTALVIHIYIVGVHKNTHIVSEGVITYCMLTASLVWTDIILGRVSAGQLCSWHLLNLYKCCLIEFWRISKRSLVKYIKTKPTDAFKCARHYGNARIVIRTQSKKSNVLYLPWWCAPTFFYCGVHRE